MMAKLSISCLYKRYHLLWIIASPFPPRFLNRDASFFDLCLLLIDASAISESRQFLVACEDCAARFAPRRLDNRVSSSSALSEARRIFLRYLSLVQAALHMRIQILQFYACVVVEVELRYVQRPLNIIYNLYIEKSLPAVRLGECMALLASESDPIA